MDIIGLYTSIAYIC